VIHICVQKELGSNPGRNIDYTLIFITVLIILHHELLNSIWNKEEQSDVWKESIIVPNYEKDYKTDCINNPGITLLSISFSQG
jgi:hypothetical protein